MQVQRRNFVAAGDRKAWAGGEVLSSIEPYVSLVGFSARGETLATVDVRADAGPAGSTAECLRFWDRSTGGPEERSGGANVSGSGRGAPYVLNTQIENPHR